MKNLKELIHLGLVVSVVVVMSGCTVMKSGSESLMQAPTLENQANRIVVGMGLVRTNTVIANMEISADALWPYELNDDLVFEENKEIISKALEDDPYVATHEYTDLYQKTYLNKGYTFLSAPKIGTLTYSALNRAIILYGKDEKNWPTFFDIETDLSSFHTFKDGTLKQVEASTSNVYPSLTGAIISLMPTNFQKDLEEADKEMINAFFEVADLKAVKGKYQTQVDINDKPIEDENGDVLETLSEEEIHELKVKILEIETSLSEKELIADEKELIFTTLLEEGTQALESDIELDEEQIALAKNIILAAAAIKKGALEAGTAFSLSLTYIATSSVVEDFSLELTSLAVARLRVPTDKWDLYDARVKRIAANALYAIPAVAIGAYYAIKQAFLAEKYETIAEIIVETAHLDKQAKTEAIHENK